MDKNPILLNTDSFTHAHVHYDPLLKAAFCEMRSEPRPCFTEHLLNDIARFQKLIRSRVLSDLKNKHETDIEYIVLSSSIEGVFNLGGDLSLFIELMKKKDKERLLEYAKLCIQDAYNFSTNLDTPVTSIALLEGNAQGGGFEAALSCNIIIAERNVLMGFPEVLFNLFPGMGAYTFLSRRIYPGLAERLITSGLLYSAEQLYEMGIVDILAEPGKGREKLGDFIRSSRRKTNAKRLIHHIHDNYNSISYDELLDITQLWVDSVLRLDSSQIKTMQRLVRAQNKLYQNEHSSEANLLSPG